MNGLVSTLKGDAIGFNTIEVWVAWLLVQMAVVVVLLIAGDIFGWQIPVLRLMDGNGFLGLVGFLLVTSCCLLWGERTAYIRKYGWR